MKRREKVKIDDIKNSIANQFNITFARFYKAIQERNKILLKKSIIPKTWLDKNKSILYYIDEKQLNLNMWVLKKK